MAPSARALLAPLLLVPLAGCLGPKPCPRDYLAYGFRSPEQTFRSFMTAFATDLPEEEYLCLAQSLKEREGVTSLTYREFRAELLEKNPFLRWIAAAEVVAIVPEAWEAEERVRIVAELDRWFVHERFAVDLVRERFYEAWRFDERLYDDFMEAFDVEGVPSGRLLISRVPWPEGIEPDELTEVRAGEEWKIDAFVRLDPEP